MPVLRGKKRNLALELAKVREEIEKKAKALLEEEKRLTKELKEMMGKEAFGEYVAGELLFKVYEQKGAKFIDPKKFEKTFGKGSMEKLAECYSRKGNIKKVSIGPKKAA
jgi:hypothetical protein